MNLASTKKIWGDIDETNSNAASTNSSLNNSTTVNSKQVNTAVKQDDQQINQSTNGPSLNSSNVVSQSQNPQTSTDPLFLSDSQWRNEPGTWTTPGDHSVSQPIMMQRSGSFPGLELSPRSGANDATGGLGLKMVEYLLDSSSPTTKDIDLRMSRLGLNDVNSANNLTNNIDQTGSTVNKKNKLDKESLDSSNTNGNLVMQNGLTNGKNGVDDLDDNKSFNKTPGGSNLDSIMINGSSTNNGLVDDSVNKLVGSKANINHSSNVPHLHSTASGNLSDQINMNGGGTAADFAQNQLTANMFQNYQDFDNPFATMDSLQFDYQMMGAIDSTGILDYSSQLYAGQARNQPPQSNQPGQLQATQQNPQLQPQHHQQPPQLLHQQPPPQMVNPNQNPQQNTTPFPQNFYAQDPYTAAQMNPHHMMPPMMQQTAYYGLPAWGHMYHPSQLNQQQLITAQQRVGNVGRPLTPSATGQPIVVGDQQNSAVVSSTAGGQIPNAHQNNAAAQGQNVNPYSMLPSQGYYDQNGLLTSNTNNNNRGTPLRMLPPMMMPNNNQAANLRLNQAGANQTTASGQPNLFGTNNNNNNYNTNGNQLTGYHNANGQLAGFAQNGPQQTQMQMQANAPQPYGSNVLSSLSASLAAGTPSNLNLSQANSPRRDSVSFDQRRQQEQQAAGMFGNNTGLFSSNGIDYSRHLANQTTAKNSYYGILPSGTSQTPPPNQQTFNNQTGNPLSNVIGLNPAANGNSATNGSNRIISAAPGAEAKYFIRNGPLSSNVFGGNSLFHTATNNLTGSVAGQAANNNLNTLTAMPMANGHGSVNHSAVGSLMNANSLVSSNNLNSLNNGSVVSGSGQVAGGQVRNSQGVPQLQRSGSLDKSAATGRSKLLEDFRNNRYSNLQLRDLNNHIVEFSQDQHGSRFIQQKLERASVAEKQLVFNEIISSAYNLMTDVFGNYVIQKFFEFGTPEQKQTLAMKVKGHVLPLALQMYGCRVIQKALESIPPEQQKDIVMELDGHVLKCVKDQNGNHVVQKCIECVDPHALQFIIGAFTNQVYALSTHPYGCRVIQRILEHCTAEQTTAILDELHSSTEQLVQDQYGNYVIQHVLEHGRPEDKSKIINNVRGKVLTLSQHKFASNVVEKCVTHANRAERAILIEEVCAYDSTHGALYTMMKDQYANYVIQKMIEIAEPPQKKLLIQRIKPHLPVLRKYTYGKHMIAKLEKYMMLKPNELQLGPIGASTNSNNGVI